MNSEHTIVQGANRIDSCAEYLKQQMAEEGYKTSVTKVAGGIVTQVHIFKVALCDVVASVLLDLWIVGNDLKFRISKGLMSGSGDVIGFPNPPISEVCKMVVRFFAKPSSAQKILEDKVFLTVSKFMTES